MKIAIHHSSGSFSERWIEYCKKVRAKKKINNQYETNQNSFLIPS